MFNAGIVRTILFSCLLFSSVSCGIFVNDGPWDLDLVFGVKGPGLASGDVYVLWPGQSAYDSSKQVNVWALDPSVYKCEKLLSSKARPVDSVFASLSIMLPPSGSRVLKNVPQVETMFYVEALDKNGALLYRACGTELARKKSNIVLQVVCTCNPGEDGYCGPRAEGPEGEQNCSNNIDDDCDGKTDAEDSNCSPCTKNTDCDDGNTCTNDVCQAGSCVFNPVDDGTHCDDGLYCNGSDSCADGTCSVHDGTNPCPGPDGDADCSESCNEASHACDGADPDSSPCDDEQDCTSDDMCHGGVCEGEPGNEGLRYPGTCDNGFDDDCDEKTDVADSDCEGCIGNGTFGSPVEYSSSYRVTFGTPADLDNDGLVNDMAIVFDSDSGPSAFLPLHFSTGSFIGLDFLHDGLGIYVSGIVADDFSKDGKTDVAVCGSNIDQTAHSITVFYQNDAKNISFGKIEYSFDKQINKMAVGDFNGDSYPDLAVTFRSSSDEKNIGILLNKSGFYSIDFTLEDVCSTPVNVLKVADVNSDGHEDILVGCGNQNTGTFRVMLGDPENPGKFTPGAQCNVGKHLMGISLADFISDGIEDVALIGEQENKVYILKGLSDGTFDCFNPLDTSLQGYPSSMDVGFFNEDGIWDLVVALEYTDFDLSQEDKRLEVLLGDGQGNVGDGTFTQDHVLLTLPEVGNSSQLSRPVWVYARDFNGDNMTDIVTGTASTVKIKNAMLLFLGQGDCQ